ncbi:MAG: VWA domain-containing protein, partial [Pirellulales bacterium]
MPSIFDYRLAFDRPGYLMLLALLPLIWWIGRRSLRAMGRGRRLVAVGARTIVVLLVIFALADAHLVRTIDRLTVIYLLDQSLSIPDRQRRAMLDFVNASVERHRDKEREDRVGVIVFGRDAAVEIPPLDDDVQLASVVESAFDPQYTDLAGAMQMALALFPYDAGKRIVVVSDGNENLGNAREQASVLVAKGVSIDVVPVELEASSEVVVEKITTPPDVRRGQPFDLRVVLSATTADAVDRTLSGKLRVVRKAGSHETLLAEQAVDLKPGKRVLTIREEITEPDFYTYEARFIPDDSADDAMPQNNRATVFTHVRGQGHVLLIEDWSAPGEFDYLVQRLRKSNLEVTVQPSDRLFTNLAELQRYDTVVLANVPRSSGEDAQHIAHFSDEQIRMLVRNTQQLGAGLVMLGGPNSFGAGGWANTELERAMPVDFQIKNAKVAPVGALALIMHASEIAEGNYWQKVVAREAIKALGSQDYCGLIHFNGTDQWLWRHAEGGMVRVGPSRKKMLARLDRMTPGDMPQFDPALQMAAASFAALRDAGVKHMIIISDGDPSPPSRSVLRSLKQLGVRVTTVAVGAHGPAGSTSLQRIANATGGKYYRVTNPKALPRIYQREARRVARPLLYQDPNGLVPRVVAPNEMVKGLPATFPPITGFVLTSLKQSHLVEVVLASPRPASERNNALLASWTYGLGKAVVLTTDAGKRWATSWLGWDDYDKFFSQLIRSSMRPVGDTGNFSVAIDIRDGQANVVITALDKRDEFLNFLEMSATVIGPDMQPHRLPIEQTAPGRYVGEFPAQSAGSYLVMVQPGGGSAPLRTGVNVGYSREFRDRDTNHPLLESMASLAPRGGRPGAVLGRFTSAGNREELLAGNPFRRDLPHATASRSVWPWLILLGTCLFVGDVFVRRVHVRIAWLVAVARLAGQRLLRRAPSAEMPETMGRLQRRKAEVQDQIDRRRATARFEVAPDHAVDPSVLEETAPSPDAPQAPPPSVASDLTPDGQDEPSYTERLLKAKKDV